MIKLKCHTDVVMNTGEVAFKALQDVIDLLPEITYVDMSEDAVIVKANKLIESLKLETKK